MSFFNISFKDIYLNKIIFFKTECKHNGYNPSVCVDNWYSIEIDNNGNFL